MIPSNAASGAGTQPLRPATGPAAPTKAKAPAGPAKPPASAAKPPQPAAAAPPRAGAGGTADLDLAGVVVPGRFALVDSAGRVTEAYRRSIVKAPATVDDMTGRYGPPTAFFNYDETLTDGELGGRWTAIAQPIALRKGEQGLTGPVRLSSAHANGSPGHALTTGLRLENRGPTQPLVLQLTLPSGGVGGHRDSRPADWAALTRMPGVRVETRPDGTRVATVTLKKGQVIDVPFATTPPHAAPKQSGKPLAPGSAAYNQALRDGAAMVTFEATLAVVQPAGATTAGLRVTDIARHDGAALAPEQARPEAAQVRNQAGAVVKPGEVKHHAGLFFPQTQPGAPVALDFAPTSPREASFAIRGAQATHDAHYDTPHAFRFTMPPLAGRDPAGVELVFRGSGGAVDPEFQGPNGRPLKGPGGRPLRLSGLPGGKAAVEVAADNPATPDVVEMKRHQETRVSLAAALKLGLVRAVGKAADGTTTYELVMRFKPGSNGNIGLSLDTKRP